MAPRNSRKDCKRINPALVLTRFVHANYGVFQQKPAPGLDPGVGTGPCKENASKQESEARL